MAFADWRFLGSFCFTTVGFPAGTLESTCFSFCLDISLRHFFWRNGKRPVELIWLRFGFAALAVFFRHCWP